jgi:hypothetical protein
VDSVDGNVRDETDVSDEFDVLHEDNDGVRDGGEVGDDLFHDRWPEDERDDDSTKVGDSDLL